MPAYWVHRVQDALNDVGKSLKGSDVLVLGAAYKPDTSDLRESPALDIIHLLQEKGARVYYHDPHIPSFRHDGFSMASMETLDLTLAEADCVVIPTDHAAYDWDAVRDNAKVIVDTRNALKRKV